MQGWLDWMCQEYRSAWLDSEFTVSTLSREEQAKDKAWFTQAANDFRGMEVSVVSEIIATHEYESKVLAQLQTIDPNTGNVGTTTRNGGEIEAKGLEVELTWAPTDALTLSGNAAFLDSEYGEFGFGNLYQAYSGSLPVIGGTPVTINGQPSVLGGTIQLAGQTTPWSPDVTFNINGSYVIDMGERGTITPSFQMAYSDSYNVAGNLPIDPAGFQDSFTKTDLRVAWDSLEGDFSVEVFVENIEDEAVNARVNVGGNDFTQTSFLMPRNSGIRVRARF